MVPRFVENWLRNLWPNLGSIQPRNFLLPEISRPWKSERSKGRNWNMSKSLYLNKTEKLAHNSTLAPYERERQGSQHGWLSCPEIPEEILSLELKALNIVDYCKALAAIEVVNLLRISSSIDRKKNNCGILWSANAVLLEVQGLLISCHADYKPQQKKYTRTNPVKNKHMRQLKINNKLN